MDGWKEGEKGLKLFGVRIVDGESRWKKEDDVMKKTMLKSLSMVNLAAYEGPAAGERGEGDHRYLSDGGLEQASRRGGQEKKRGVPWTEEEHRTFLAGLEKLGKGDWRGISRNFVMTRTPTQVASHAQKYFLRKNNPNKKKRRSSLFDVIITNKITNSEILPLPLKKTDETLETLDQSPSQNQRSFTLDQEVPTFLNLSNSSTIDCSDLELTIAPPQPHSGLANFSSGIIRVV